MQFQKVLSALTPELELFSLASVSRGGALIFLVYIGLTFPVSSAEVNCGETLSSDTVLDSDRHCTDKDSPLSSISLW